MPVLLSRQTGRLLRTVNKKPHASDDDHEADISRSGMKAVRGTGKPASTQAEKSIPTPPGTNSTDRTQLVEQQTIDLTDEDDDVDRDPIDWDADPESDISLSGVDSPAMMARSTTEKTVSVSRTHTNRSPAIAVSRAESQLPGKQGDKRSNKRSSASPEREFMDIYDTQRQFKKRCIQSRTAGSSGNIHALPAKPSKLHRPKVYGKSSQQPKEGVQCFKRGRSIWSPSKSPGKQFKAKTDPVVEDTGPAFKTRVLELEDITGDTQYLKADLGDLSSDEGSSEPDPGHDPSITIPSQTDPVTECAFCGEKVDKFLKEDFEDLYNKGKALSFKWERRFCRFHRRHRAADVWEENRYPMIGWASLEERMRQHDDFLVKVLQDDTPSHYRQALKEKLQPGKRGLQQAIADDGSGRPGASVGYYGPRGEKLMVEHVISSMSSKIRSRATKDKLVAATGVQGGVAGFIQSVLVPHLAELLIKEDMNLGGKDWSCKAREIIASSAELGELMHPEVEDLIVQQNHDEDD